VGRPLFTILVADVERNDQHLSWSVPAAWLDEQLQGTEAKAAGPDGKLKAYLTKNGREFLVRATAKVMLEMPCARTQDPVEVPIVAELFLLLSKGAPTARNDEKQRARARAESTRKRRQQEDEETLLSEEDAARDTYQGEEIVLDSFVREQMLLELPMFPLRSDLRSSDSPARAAPSRTAEDGEKPLDPRLAPLAALKERLREKKE
jgi:uncharacterized protein